MSVIGRGTLAAALATAMAVAPSLAQEPVAAKAASSTASTITNSERKPGVLELAGDYSMDNPVVAIAIYKGQKDNITGEKIGETLAGALSKVHGVPAKYFVEPGADYSSIGFMVNGYLYGPYGLKESLSGLTLAAAHFHSQQRRGVGPHAQNTSSSRPIPANSFAAKPEPRQ